MTLDGVADWLPAYTVVVTPELVALTSFAILCVFSLFWLIRLAVRYGVNDALRAHRKWLDARGAGDVGQGGAQVEG